MSQAFSFNSKFDSFKDGKQHQDSDNNDNHSSSNRRSNEDMNYSPRSSIVYSDDQVNNKSANQTGVGSDYKGFHHGRKPGNNVPPLSQPIKPRFRKKGSSLLGKLIYSTRKDSESSNHSTQSNVSNNSDSSSTSAGSMPDQVGNLPNFHNQRGANGGSQSGDSYVYRDDQSVDSTRHLSIDNSHDHPRKSVSSTASSGSSGKFKFRLSSLSFDHNPHHLTSSKSQRGSASKSRNNSGASDNSKSPTQRPDIPEVKTNNGAFNIDIDLNDLNDIVKTPSPNQDNSLKPSKSTTRLSPLKKIHSNVIMPKPDDQYPATGGGAWKAPDSWDVKVSNLDSGNDISEANSDSDSDTNSNVQSDSNPPSSVNLVSAPTTPQKKSSVSAKSDTFNKTSWNTASFSSQGSVGKDKLFPQPKDSGMLPVLYGSKNASHVVSLDNNTMRTNNHIVRVFREDNTFATILNSLETTTSELLQSVQKKFFLESTQNYQLSVHIGNYVKILEPFERPLKIQTGLLLLSGYKETDNLRMIGSEDLSYICKFVVENVYLRSLTHEEEVMLSKDYVNVDISGLNLKNIPIIFHQHTYEIESLNVADNPAIYIPLDFIQSCSYLNSLTFARNGCSKFPSNFLEARSLKYLDMEKNFLDELPQKFGHLKALKHLKLNSNQLNSLPKSFLKLQNLETLNLSSNYFNSYPDPISDLVNLKDLDLSYNDLSSLPRSISNLTKLSKLNLCTNKLSRGLPKFFEEFVCLKRLDIRYNYITDIDVLGSLPKLEAVYASKNYISRFSDKMESFRLLHFDRNPITNLKFNNILSRLTVLDLSKAKLTIIPNDFFDKISNIEKLVLDKNHLVNLPDNLGNLHKLSYLSLYGNNLQVLPKSVGNLISLQYLDLHSNNLQVLPDEIWNLKSLVTLNVSSNILISFPKPPLELAKKLSSTANLANLSSEKKVNEMQSISEGSIHEHNDSSRPVSPTNMQAATSSLIDNLTVLALADNRLSDECFSSLSILTQLKVLNLSYNDLIEIPEGALRRMLDLRDLYLSGNELSSLPSDDFEKIKSLRLFFLNNNKLVSLPAELSKLLRLEALDVGSNQLKYNISNWPYDWNWHWNNKLKYLNFSGNKRFEIKQSHVKNPETGEYFDSLLVLQNLKVLGLIDVTLTTTAVPDQNVGMRIRTTASELDNIGYGVSDTMGLRDYVSSRDLFIQKYRGNENEVLFASFDGKGGATDKGHRISSICKHLISKHLAEELDKIKSDDDIPDALRKTFLILNKEINGVLAARKSKNQILTNQVSGDLADMNLLEDGNAGCSITVVYVKDKMLFTANIGDTEALLSRSNGDHVLLTTKHDPTSRTEFERIRASGGYVSGDGTLDGDLFVSRGAGFFNYLPHLHSGPDIKSIELTKADDKIVLATKVFWDYIPYELAVDIIRSEKDDPMLAAQKLRDFAISYGASDKIAVMVIALGEQKRNRQRFGTNIYNNLGHENEFYSNKKRRDRAQGDTALRMLDDEIEPPVGDLALVFTDIKNSTLLWDAYPVAMRSAIKIHNAIMRRQLRIVGGYEVKTEGDAFMVSFPSPTSALLWCFNVQQQLLTADWPVEILETDQCFEVTDNAGHVIYRGLSVRMGIHWGSPVCELDVVTRRMDYFGPMVNRASRISAIADGGQVCVSSDFIDEINSLMSLHEEIVDKKVTMAEAYQGYLAAGEIIESEINQLQDIGIVYYEMGEKKLKGLEAPEHITLAFPKKLLIRFEIYNQHRSSTAKETSRIFGALPVDTIFRLRTVSLKLERILLTLSGTHVVNDFQENSSNTLSSKPSLFHENDLIGLFNHVVVRIENCVAVLNMRQQLSTMDGSNNMKMHVGTDVLMNDLVNIIEEFKSVVK